MSVRKRLMLGLGRFYELLFRIPLSGESLVRGITRSLGFLIYHTPQGPRPCETMAEFKQDFARMTALMDFDLETIQHGEDRLEIIITACPYGYCRPDQQGVCDAAMDMDRAMFGHAGYELTIDACIPRGAPACLVSIRRKS
ncbi:MAG: hypothetical protein JW854_14735 [Actinobacteria bacterium]|nr:hypothetical protein [Actinomycetota bacterium]